VLSFKADVYDNEVNVKQPLLEAAGEWNKKQIIGVKREKGRGMPVVYSAYKKVDHCKGVMYILLVQPTRCTCY